MSQVTVRMEDLTNILPSLYPVMALFPRSATAGATTRKTFVATTLQHLWENTSIEGYLLFFITICPSCSG